MSNGEQIIKIYNPQEKPFGHLSNNWYYPIRINDKIYPTVTNYILSNMVTTPLYQIILQNAKIMPSNRNIDFYSKVQKLVDKIEKNQNNSLSEDEKENIAIHVKFELDVEKHSIYSLYNTYLRLEYMQTVRSAIEEAYNKRFTEDDMVQLLLSTKNRPIHYLSQNTVLGINSEGQGTNLVGRVLTQIRTNLKRQKKQYEEDRKEEEMNEKIFNTYIASQILIHQINKGKNIDRYIHKTADQILNMFKQGKDMEYVLNMLQIDPKVKEEVVSLYNRKGLKELHEEIKTPGSLSINTINRLSAENLHKIKNIVFKSFVVYYAKKKKKYMTDKQLEQAYNELKFQIPGNNSHDIYLEYKERVYDLFLSKNLPSDLLESINNKTKDIKVFSEQEIMEIEDIEPSELTNQDIEIIEDNSDSKSSDSESDSNDSIKKNFLSDDKREKRDLLEKIKTQTGLGIKFFKNKTTEELRRLLGSNKTEKNKLIDVAKKQYITITREKIDKLVSKLEKYKKKGIDTFKTSDGSITTKEISRNYSDALSKLGDNNSFMGKVWVITSKAERKSENKNEGKEEVVNNIEEKVWSPDPGMEDVEQLIGHKTVGDPVNIYASPTEVRNGFEAFSPLYNKVVTIGGVNFPNIAMVITARLFQKTGVSKVNKGYRYKGMGFKQVLEYIRPNNRFVSNEQADRIYMEVNYRTYIELEPYFMKIALNEKFKSVELQELLLITGKNTLVWNDPNNTLLGVGTKKQPGQNIGGKLLMDKRTELKKTFTRYKIINSSVLGNAIEADKFLYDWVEMRLNDMCSVVAKLKKYLYYSTNIDEEINERFVKNVITDFYPSCVCLENFDNKANPVPKVFFNLLLACPEMQLSLEKTHSLQAYKDNSSEKVLKDAREMMDHYKQELNNLDEGDVSDETKNLRNILKGNIAKMKISIQQQSTDYKEKVKKVVQVYWNWISRILSAIIMTSTLKDDTGNKAVLSIQMKKILANAEFMLSKDVNCTKILNNKQDNCIASALLNVLVSIAKFKYKYGENIPLDENDIRMAATIILNRDMSEVPVQESKKDREYVYEEYDNPIEDDGLYESDEESDADDEIELIQGKEENIEFSFDDKERIDVMAKLQEIYKDIANPVNLTSFFLGMIDTIKSIPMSKKLKLNRINFFATLI